MDGNPCQLALTCSDNEVSVGEDPNGRYAQAEKAFDWTYSFVDGFFNVDFEDVSSFGSAVDVGVVVVDGCIGELSFDVAEVGVEGLYFLVDLVDGEDLNAVVLDCDKASAVVIEEEDFIDYFLVGSSVETLPTLDVPNDEHVPTCCGEYLSSRQPWEARRRESGEKARLVTDCLCSLNLCLTWRVLKSQMMTSATCPGKECSALARCLPSFEILMAG